MRIKLEWEDGPVFASVKAPGLGQGDYRALTVKIHGKPFSVWVNYITFFADDPSYMRSVDEQLVASMERMFARIFTDACAAIPEGTDLMLGKGSETP